MITLIDQVRHWLTPRATDTGKGERTETFVARMGDRTENCFQSLAAQVCRGDMWPTASARDWKDTPGMARQGTNPDGTERKRDDMLARRVYSVTYPTSTKSDGTGGPGNSPGRGGDNLRTAVQGSLNPDWVEWLMGWPIFISSLEYDSYISMQLWEGMQHDKKRMVETGTADVSLDCVCCVWNRQEAEQASQGQGCITQYTGKRSDTVCELSCQGSPRNGNAEKSKTSFVCGMRKDVSAETIAERARLFSGMSFDNGEDFSGEEVGNENNGKALCLLWKYIHTTTAKGKDVFAFLWEQARLGKTQWEVDPADTGHVSRVGTGIKNRAARLKAIGNGQCPQAMVLAWNILKVVYHV